MENPMVIHLDYSDKDQTLSVRNKIKIKKGCCKIRNGTEELICPLSADLQLAYHNY